MITFS
ncbi:hypothetical protein MAR_021073 [Mya arenaria]